MVGFELGGGGAGGLVGLTGQFIDMLTTLGDLGGGDGFLVGGTPPLEAMLGPDGGTGLVGFESNGGGLGARLCLPKLRVGGLVGMLGGLRFTLTLSVESFYFSF